VGAADRAPALYARANASYFAVAPTGESHRRGDELGAVWSSIPPPYAVVCAAMRGEAGLSQSKGAAVVQVAALTHPVTLIAVIASSSRNRRERVFARLLPPADFEFGSSRRRGCAEASRTRHALLREAASVPAQLEAALGCLYQ